MKEVKDSTKLARLNKLIKYLKKLNDTEPERFDLQHWMGKSMGSSYNDKIETARDEWRDRYKDGRELNCGTSACVVGHLPVLFPSAWAWSLSDVVEVFYTWGENNSCENKGRALATFFGGTEWQWGNIIFPSGYCNDSGNIENAHDKYGNVTLSAVIDKIEKLKENNYKKPK